MIQLYVITEGSRLEWLDLVGSSFQTRPQLDTAVRQKIQAAVQERPHLESATFVTISGTHRVVDHWVVRVAKTHIIERLDDEDSLARGS